MKQLDKQSIIKSVPHTLRLEREVDYKIPYIGKTTITETKVSLLSGASQSQSFSEKTFYPPIIYVVAVPSMDSVAIPKPFDIVADWYSEKSEVTEAEPPEIIQLHKRVIVIRDTEDDPLMKSELVDSEYSGVGWKSEEHGYKFVPDIDKITHKIRAAATEFGLEEQLDKALHTLLVAAPTLTKGDTDV